MGNARTAIAAAGGLALALGAWIPLPAVADGMLPQTSVVIVNEAEGEASLKVTNSDKRPSLLLVTLQDIPEDPARLLRVEPMVSRVEPGKSQMVRFLLQADAPLKTQRLKRVLIEGLADRDPTAPGHIRIGIGVRQNLPVILHPAGLPMKRDPWTLLGWSLAGDRLTVRNDSPYVVRLSQEVHLAPGNATAMLSRTYILPGEQLSATVTGGQAEVVPQRVRLSPATLYGYVTSDYEAPLAGAGG